MSSQPRQPGIVISVSDLINEAERLKQYIDSLQKALSDVNESINAIEDAKKLLNQLQQSPQGEIFTTADRRGYLLLKLQGVNASKVLIHLGSKYYVEVDPSAGIQVLQRQEDQLKDLSTSIQQELAKQLQVYNQIVDLLNQIQAKAAESATQKGG
ncbi:MAG: prefoldin subunit alpha [Sulfolobaceae archaeon]|nr:prefoldin subunit alpha [Sulfolobaceae archaeon]